MGKVITIGEVLIDFIPQQLGTALQDVEGFTKEPGGAPTNVAVGVARLGGHAKLIGKVGTDAFGRYLVDMLRKEKVDIGDITFSGKANTALAFVSLDLFGERDFAFYRNPSADMLFSATEIKDDFINKDDILHFGSVGLIESPLKYAHEKAIRVAKEHNALVIFDPNVSI